MALTVQLPDLGSPEAQKLADMLQSPLSKAVEHIPRDYYPSDSGHLFIIEQGIDKKRRMFFRDHTNVPKRPACTVLLVHGNPENSYCYRRVIAHLNRQNEIALRIVAPDHLGFGLSDPAQREMVDMDHAENLLDLVNALDLHRIILVVHDWGGPIGIGALLREPKRVHGLVVLNSTVFPMPESGLTYQNYPISWLPWCRTPYVIPDWAWGSFCAYAVGCQQKGAIGLLWGLNIHIMGSLFGWSPHQQRHVWNLIRAQFASKQNVRSSKRLVLQTKSWGIGSPFRDPKLGIRDNRAFFGEIQDRLSCDWGPDGQNIPVGAIFGAWDPLAKTEILTQWCDALPQIRDHIRVYEKRGHFIEEEEPEAIAKEIIRVSKVIAAQQDKEEKR